MTDQPAGHLQGCQFFGSTPVGEPENCPKCGALIQPAAASAPPVIPVGATAVRPDRRPMFALGAIGLVALVAVSAMAIGAVGSGGSGAKATSSPTRPGNHVYAGKFRLAGDQTGWQSMSIKSMQNQTATLLANGKILLVGGGSGAEAGSADAELYDPKAEALTSTGSMSATRVGHTATLLPDGKVLVAGGAPSVGMYGELASAELYDPATGAFARTGSMTAGRIGHTATLLKNGKVLIAGGYEGYLEGAINWADIYDPNTGTFSPTGSMTAARSEHTATLLTDGRVLIAGGMSGPINHRLPLDSAELYDPTTGTFSPTGKLAGTRSEQTATLLSDGRVLLIGGRGSYPPVSLSSAELYDPKAGDFTLTGDLGESLTRHQATLLQDGRVLVTGGMPGGSSTFGYGPCSVYDPKTGQFHATVNMSDGRAGHTATLLPDGSVLVVGGESGSYLRAEVYQ